MEFGPIFRSLLRNRARVVLIVAEVALTLAIVANCLSLILDTRAQLARPSGFDDEHIAVVQSNPFDDRLRDPGRPRPAGGPGPARPPGAVAGVRAVTHTGLRPWERSGNITAMRVPGTHGEPVRTQRAEADPGLFATLGISIAQGRGFTEAEYDHGADAPLDEVLPVVVSRALARPALPRRRRRRQAGRLRRRVAALSHRGRRRPLLQPVRRDLRKGHVPPRAARRASTAARTISSAPRGRPGRLLPQLEKTLLGVEKGRFLRTAHARSRTATSSTAATGCWSPRSTPSWRCWCW